MELARLQVRQKLIIQILPLQQTSRQARALLLHTMLTAEMFLLQARLFRRPLQIGTQQQTEAVRHTMQAQHTVQTQA